MKLIVTGEPRRIVLEVSRQDVKRTSQVIRHEVMNGRIPRYHFTDDDKARFEVPLKYLAGMVDTFVQAEYGKSVQKWMAKRHSQNWEDDPNLVVPGMVGTQLRPFQRIGVNAALSMDSFMIHDDMGLGKTFEALATIAIREAFPCLIVSPATVKDVWGGHIADYFPSWRVAVVGGTKPQRMAQINSGADVVVINYEAVRLHPELVEHDWQAIVLDEFHRTKTAKAQMTQAIHQIQAPYKLLLSGTPILNGRLEELWAPLHYCFPDEFPGNMETTQPDWLFRRKYCIVVDGKIVGYRRVPQLRRKLHDRSIRRRKEEVLTELPEKVYSVRYVELTKEQRKLYRSIKDQMLLWMEDGKKKTIRDVRVKVMRLKQACFSPELYGGSATSAKIAELKAIVAELAATGHKALVFSQWATASRIIARELSDYRMSYVDGKVPSHKRKEEIARFQRDPETMLYVGTIRANMVGITLTKADYVIFTDLEWTPAYNEQASDRAHRIGQTKRVNVLEIQALDTIEERIARLLEGKQEMNDLLTERGPIPRLTKHTIKSIAEIL